MCANEKKCAVARTKKCILCAFCVRSPFFAFFVFIQLFFLSFVFFHFICFVIPQFSVYFAFLFLQFVTFPFSECLFHFARNAAASCYGMPGVWGTNTTVQYSRSIREPPKTFKP